MFRMILSTLAVSICRIHALRSLYLLNRGISFLALWTFNQQKQMHFLRMIAPHYRSLRIRSQSRYKTRFPMNSRIEHFLKPKSHRGKWQVRHGKVTRRGLRGEATAMTESGPNL